MKKLYLMCGLPGSGKSTWIKDTVEPNHELVVSRDEIRFFFMDSDEYFKHETVVFRCFIAAIQEGLYDDNFDAVYADATHLTEASRKKLLDKLDLEGVEVIPVVVLTPLRICIDRNNQREGVKKVPEEVIKDMRRHISYPTRNEFPYKEIKEVKNW